MARQTWLVKTEPEEYAWSRLVADGRTVWDGVRNYQARNNLRAMRLGDRALYYHTSDERSVVGVAEVVREHYPDPAAPDEDWSVVDLAPVAAFARPVTLAEIKAHPDLAATPLVRQGRLSVVPMPEEAFRRICGLGGVPA